jgi:hypothetical protein
MGSLSVSGFCPSSGISNIRKHNFSEIGFLSVFKFGDEDTCSVGSLGKN